MDRVINGKRYSTETGTLVASDYYWDGSNMERHGRNTFLYKTPNSRFFLYHTTRWQGERDKIEAVTFEVAERIYGELPEIELEYAAAFGVEPEEA